MLSETPSNTLEVHGLFGTSRGICTANPLNIDHLLRTNFHNFIKGSRFHNVLYDLLGHGIFNVDGHLWTSQRKIASHEFNTRSLKSFISHTVHFEISDRLLPYLSTSCDEGEIIDLQDTFRKFAFDNICNLAFGDDPVCLNLDKTKASSSSSFVQAFDDAVEISASRFMAPLPWIWKIKRFLNIGSEKKLKEAIRVVNDYAIEIIKSKEEEQANNQNSNQDLLSRFMSSSNNSLEFQDQEQKRRFLKDIVLSFILAGKDSTSTALTWFFWLISANPRCERLIYAELSSAPAIRSGIFRYDDMKQLNYLHAAVSESLRLFPPVPINSRLTVRDDVLPDGTHVGAGWFADYSAYAIGRMEKVWGPDCKEFVPERWLDKDGAFVAPDQFRFPVFHCGPRMCLGKDMAYVQMKSIAAAVIYNFEVVAVDGGGGGGRMMQPPYTFSIVLKMKGGLPVHLKRRSQSCLFS
ncbi:hypothetical protein HHK36_017190 [Tetracentron sinense]|uniref:Cytochrome P450 n=1 Tax=Tetracentron sinense TaxID=13715 RepID=A0A835DCC0_TETSI|nr:hypothetical protein HHK36_017190 [Tetracentron sinense]